MTPAFARRLGPEVEAVVASYQSEKAGRSERNVASLEPWCFTWPEEDADIRRALTLADPSLASDGWELAVVDLTHVRAFQPIVSVDDPRCHMLDASTRPRDLAALCVPGVPLESPRTAFDERTGSWVLRGPTSNLRVTGRFAGPVDGTDVGSNGFGFIVSAQPSRVEVVVVGGVPVLRDGYHRAVGLLARGVTKVPALISTSDHVLDESVGFPLETVRAPDGPRLTDFLDEYVSRPVPVARTERVLLIQSLDVEMPA